MSDFKSHFPIFTHHPDLVYLDSAATTQKPASVLAAMQDFYEHTNANIYRGRYDLSEMATAQYEAGRDQVKNFINAQWREEIIFTHGTTEGINAVAYTWGEQNIKTGDEIALTYLEHHANIVPWLELARRKGAVVKAIDITDDGNIDLVSLTQTISAKTKLVAVTHVSNVLGTIVPLEQVIAQAKAVGARVLVDAAQSIAHLPVDVQNMDCDWLVFSGHKMYGPTGVGVLYGKREVLETMSPFLFGGGMIDEVDFQRATWAPIPERFESGTPPIAEVIGLSAAITWLQTIGWPTIQAHEQVLSTRARSALRALAGVEIQGNNDANASGVISFIMPGIHPHDIASIANEFGVAVRADHHCAQPLLKRLGVSAITRASIGIYNESNDIDRLIAALAHARKIFH